MGQGLVNYTFCDNNVKLQKDKLINNEYPDKDVGNGSLPCNYTCKDIMLEDAGEIQSSCETRNMNEYCSSSYSDNSTEQTYLQNNTFSKLYDESTNSTVNGNIQPNKCVEDVSVKTDKQTIDNYETSSDETAMHGQDTNGSDEAGDQINFSGSESGYFDVNDESEDLCSVNFKLGVWNISGLKSKLNEQNDSFDNFISLFDIICFVETWADENDFFQIEGFTEPFVSIRNKHPHAWRNSGGIAVFLKESLTKYCRVTRLVSLSESRNLIWLKFDFLDMLKGVPIICGFTYLFPENSSVHAEEDLFHIMEADVAAHRSNFESHCILLAGDFNAYTGRELDFIQHDESFDLLDNLGYVEDAEPPPRNNQDGHEMNAYGKNLFYLCVNTGLRIVNGRYGSDSEVGNYTCISELSASTIDYIIIDEDISKYITDFQVEDSLESINMPLALDLQFWFGKDVEHNDLNETHNINPPKFTWNSEKQQNYNNQLRINLECMSDDFHNAIANRNIEVPLKLLLEAVYKAAEIMKKTRL